MSPGSEVNTTKHDDGWRWTIRWTEPDTGEIHTRTGQHGYSTREVAATMGCRQLHAATIEAKGWA
jgi:hypothetical protein